MAGYKYPEVSIVKNVYNVTRMFEADNDGQYDKAQGYTVSNGSNLVHFITSIETNDNVAIAHVTGKQSDNGHVSGRIATNRHYGHANDCTFYDNHFFIAQGGGGKELTKIICLDKTLTDQSIYNYKPMNNSANGVAALGSVSGIASIGHGYFALSQGMKVSICELHRDTKVFKEISRFRFSKIGDHLTRDGYRQVPQGIYCTASKIYKVFSYETENGNEKIKRNDIGVFKFNSSTPSMIDKATFETSYSCDRTGKQLFEVESIGSPDGGNTMYMLTNIEEKGGKQTDVLYQVSFS